MCAAGVAYARCWQHREGRAPVVGSCSSAGAGHEINYMAEEEGGAEAESEGIVGAKTATLVLCPLSLLEARDHGRCCHQDFVSLLGPRRLLGSVFPDRDIIIAMGFQSPRFGTGRTPASYPSASYTPPHRKSLLTRAAPIPDRNTIYLRSTKRTTTPRRRPRERCPLSISSLRNTNPSANPPSNQRPR